jgi:hypothetical protein
MFRFATLARRKERARPDAHARGSAYIRNAIPARVGATIHFCCKDVRELPAVVCRLGLHASATHGARVAAR